MICKRKLDLVTYCWCVEVIKLFTDIPFTCSLIEDLLDYAQVPFFTEFRWGSCNSINHVRGVQCDVT
jgi:hypothetical protein